MEIKNTRTWYSREQAGNVGSVLQEIARHKRKGVGDTVFWSQTNAVPTNILVEINATGRGVHAEVGELVTQIDGRLTTFGHFAGQLVRNPKYLKALDNLN